jgi:hypothetical protein
MSIYTTPSIMLVVYCFIVFFTIQLLVGICIFAYRRMRSCRAKYRRVRGSASSGTEDASAEWLSQFTGQKQSEGHGQRDTLADTLDPADLEKSPGIELQHS